MRDQLREAERCWGGAGGIKEPVAWVQSRSLETQGQDWQVAWGRVRGGLAW